MQTEGVHRSGIFVNSIVLFPTKMTNFKISLTFAKTHISKPLPASTQKNELQING